VKEEGKKRIWIIKKESKELGGKGGERIGDNLLIGFSQKVHRRCEHHISVRCAQTAKKKWSTGEERSESLEYINRYV
jgi:hypothetical protein